MTAMWFQQGRDGNGETGDDDDDDDVNREEDVTFNLARSTRPPCLPAPLCVVAHQNETRRALAPFI